MAREVDHRAKNMLSVVQAMVQLSRGTDIASYTEAPTLTRAGIEVLGPATDVRQAIDLLSETDADIVLLDINLNGEKGFPVAESLTKRSTPFIFCAGYAAQVILPPRFSHVPVLAKPYTVDQLFHAMNRAVPQPPFPNA